MPWSGGPQKNLEKSGATIEISKIKMFFFFCNENVYKTNIFNSQYHRCLFTQSPYFYCHGRVDKAVALLLLIMVSYRLWKELWGRINYLTKLETTKPQQGAMQRTREKDRSYVKWDYSALLKYGMKIPYENGWRLQTLDAYWIHYCTIRCS